MLSRCSQWFSMPLPLLAKKKPSSVNFMNEIGRVGGKKNDKKHDPSLPIP